MCRTNAIHVILAVRQIWLNSVNLKACSVGQKKKGGCLYSREKDALNPVRNERAFLVLVAGFLVATKRLLDVELYLTFH
jgi:hypothetical protein